MTEPKLAQEFQQFPALKRKFWTEQAIIQAIPEKASNFVIKTTAMPPAWLSRLLYRSSLFYGRWPGFAAAALFCLF